MIAVIIVAYVIGSIPFALMLARGRSVSDLRQIGSGNIGATNVVRASGMTAGVAVALLDMAKGAAGVLLAERLDGSPAAAAAAGLAAIIGHVFPVWLQFRGGKGVATACGVFLLLAPIATASALAIFALSVWMTRYVSFGSILASAALPPFAYATGSSMMVVASSAAAATLIVFRHRSNLARLRAHTEQRFERRASR